MANLFFDPFSADSHVKLESIFELNAISTRIWSEMARQGLQVSNDWIKSSGDHIQNLSKTKGVEEVVSLNTQWLKKMAPNAIEHAQMGLDTVMEGIQELQQWSQKTTQSMSTSKEVPPKREKA